jgi:plastocyanin
MKSWFLASTAALSIGILAGCGGGGSAGNGAAGAANPVPNAFLSNSQQPDAVAEALVGDPAKVIYVGFGHKALPKSKFGAVAFYAPTTGATAVIYVKSGSKVSFLNDDSTRHTASGLGAGGFPKSFDNTSGVNQVGKVINSSLTWSTGSLNPGQTSVVLTVGAKGTYYFGCYFHYRVDPAMRDVIVSQ